MSATVKEKKKMRRLHNIVVFLLLLCVVPTVSANEHEGEPVNVKEIVFGHIGDSYEWHITTWGKQRCAFRFLS